MKQRLYFIAILVIGVGFYFSLLLTQNGPSSAKPVQDFTSSVSRPIHEIQRENKKQLLPPLRAGEETGPRLREGPAEFRDIFLANPGSEPSVLAGGKTSSTQTVLERDGRGPDGQVSAAPRSRWLGRDARSVSPSGLNGRVTQAEVNALKDGLSQTLTAIEQNLVQQVFAETLPLVGTNFVLAWSNNVGGFRYVNTLRTNIVNGLSTLTNQADYSPTNLQTAINTRLTSAGFNAGSGVVVTTPNDFVQLVFTSSDTFAATAIPLATNFGIPNAQLFTLNQTNCSSALGVIFNFTSGVDGSGFYLETTGAPMQFNTTNTIGNLSNAVRFARLPFTLTDNTTNRTSVPLNFLVILKDPNGDGQLRVSELSGSPDLLDATVTGNTKLSFKLLSSLPGAAMLPQVGTDFKLLWNFTAATVNPNDNNSIFGSVPTLTLENNRINLESFFKAFAERALDQIDQTTKPLQPVIDVLTAVIPLLSDLGSDAVTILTILGVDESTVAALGELAALIDLANFARNTSGNSSVFVDLGSYALGGDLRDDKLDDLPGALSRPATGSGNSALANFKNKAAAISGLAFPILDDANVAANLLLGRNATLFTWRSGEIEFSEQFQQFFPVLGPVGITLGGHVGLKTQFGFGYDTQGVFDFYSGGSANSDLLNNGFFASALDEMGQPLTGITLSAGITAGIAANIVIASVGVEGDLTATVGIYLDNLLGDGQGRVRGQTLLNTPLTKLFYASGSLSAGLRAYLEIGLTPFSVSFDFESPRVTLISFDTQVDQTPVLGNFHAGDNELVLNVGARASFRLHGDLEDRAEEFFVGNSSSGGVTVFAFNAKNDFPLPSLILADGNLRGDSLTTAADMNVPVHFTGGPGFDKLTGGGGNDVLEGGDGPDNLSGRGGNDILLGGADNDELNGGDGFDMLDGGPGLDTASWVGSSIALVMDLRTGYFGGAATGDTLISIERYEGTTHDDIMDGSEGDDSLLRGEAGNDTIRGHGGSDQLEGGEGNDILEGGDGDDYLVGGPGADMLDGGPGLDIVSYLGAESPVTVSLRTGLGTRGDALGDVLTNFEILMGSGLPKQPGSVLASGDDLEGSDNADTIYGMDGADTIHGLGGNDIIYGNHPDAVGSLKPGYDADKIYGGAGNDVIYGQADDDTLDGEDGVDMLYGGTGNDHLITMDLLNPDYLEGGEGFNRLSADYSDKITPLNFIVGRTNSFSFPDGDTFTNMQTLGTLKATSSNDVIRLAAQQEVSFYSKTIDAGAGDDLVIADWRGFYGVSPNQFRTTDVLIGGPGNDTLSFEQSIASVTVNLANNTVGGAAAGLTISGFENLIGTLSADFLTGDTNDNIINPIATLPLQPGSIQNDRVDGGNGSDTLRLDFSILAEVNSKGVSMGPNSGAGYMTIALGQSPSPFGVTALLSYLSIERFELIGGATNDQFYGEAVGAYVNSSTYTDRFFGMGGNDHLEGRWGDDYLDGGEGDDTLLAGAGNDTVIGGPGNDSITFAYADNSFSTYGTDICDAGPGDDFVRDANAPGNDSSQATATTVFKFDGGEGYDTLQIDVGNMTTPFIFDENNPPAEIILPNGGYLRNFEHITAITTGSGNDILILPGRVNNTIAMKTGDDVLNPGIGFDSVNGGTGGDDLLILDYSVGDDADTAGIIWNPNISTYQRRLISTNVVVDQLSVVGFERVHFIGTSKADNIIGYSGDDQIFGGAGNDTISASSGNDWIDGGLGADTMLGSTGNDTFIVDDPGDVVTESSGQGTDTVRASIDYTLPANVEYLVLTGSATNATGNSSANILTGNSRNNYLRGEGGIDTLDGGGGAHEIDRLNGGANADTFVLGNGGTRYYDDGNPATPGLDGYALIEDFLPSQGDRLKLAGSAVQYFLTNSPIAGITGWGLYHDSNGNTNFDAATDELIAILQSTETLTVSNTINNALYTSFVDPAVVGLTTNSLQTTVTNDGAEKHFTVSFSILEPMTNGITLAIQSSTDLGVDDPWLTIASKIGAAAWTGSATISVGTPANGRVTVTITETQPVTLSPKQFFRALLSQP